MFGHFVQEVLGRLLDIQIWST